MGFNDLKLFDTDNGAEYNLEDLFKEIHSNAAEKREALQVLTDKLMSFINTPNDAAVIVPLISEFLSTAVFNDDSLVKLASIISRVYMKAQTSPTDGPLLLTEEEKADLLKELKALPASSDKLSSVDDLLTEDLPKADKVV